MQVIKSILSISTLLICLKSNAQWQLNAGYGREKISDYSLTIPSGRLKNNKAFSEHLSAMYYGSKSPFCAGVFFYHSHYKMALVEPLFWDPIALQTTPSSLRIRYVGPMVGISIFDKTDPRENINGRLRCTILGSYGYTSVRHPDFAYLTPIGQQWWGIQTAQNLKGSGFIYGGSITYLEEKFSLGIIVTHNEMTSTGSWNWIGESSNPGKHYQKVINGNVQLGIRIN